MFQETIPYILIRFLSETIEELTLVSDILSCLEVED